MVYVSLGQNIYVSLGQNNLEGIPFQEGILNILLHPSILGMWLGHIP
jgi:hypothetical protein